jgi:hypothetical protein
MTLPDKFVPNAHDVGNGGLLSVALSLVSLFLAGRTGGTSLIFVFAFAVVAALAGIASARMSRKISAPRPWQATVALSFGIVLASGLILLALLLSDLSKHH